MSLSHAPRGRRAQALTGPDTTPGAMRNGKSYKAAAAPARKSSPKGPWRSVNPGSPRAARKAAWPQLGPETSAWRAPRGAAAAAAPPARGTQTDARPGPEVVARADLAAAADGFAHPLAADVAGAVARARRGRAPRARRRRLPARRRRAAARPPPAREPAAGLLARAGRAAPGGALPAGRVRRGRARGRRGRRGPGRGARVRALADAGRGLAHLHGVHVRGRRRGAAILLDADARARLCLGGAGRCRVVDGSCPILAAAAPRRGYGPPDPPPPSPAALRAADVYAPGVVALELLTGRAAFDEGAEPRRLARRARLCRTGGARGPARRGRAGGRRRAVPRGGDAVRRERQRRVGPGGRRRRRRARGRRLRAPGGLHPPTCGRSSPRRTCATSRPAPSWSPTSWSAWAWTPTPPPRRRRPCAGAAPRRPGRAAGRGRRPAGGDRRPARCRRAAWLATLAAGSAVDARDSEGRWFDGVVTAAEADRVRVHFRGWQDTWDVWIETRDELRLQPPFARTDDWRASLAAGDACEVRDAKGPMWFQGRVVGTTEEAVAVRTSTGVVYDVARASERLCRIGTHGARGRTPARPVST